MQRSQGGSIGLGGALGFRRGAARSNTLIYLLFVLLAGAIVTFITIGYQTFQEDMKLSTKRVTIGMHPGAKVQPEAYTILPPEDIKENGEITEMHRTAEPVMSVTEKLVIVVGGILFLGIIAGIVMLFTKLRQAGKIVCVVGTLVVMILGGAEWYLMMHRETPYSITMLPETKKNAVKAPEPLTFATDDSTAVKLKEKADDVLSLREGMKVQVVFTQDKELATNIESPIPVENPRNEPKRGVIVSVEPDPEVVATAGAMEKFFWGLTGLMGVGIVIGLVMVMRKSWKSGLALAVLCGGGLPLCVWKFQFLETHRARPLIVVIQPKGRDGQKADALTVKADSTTVVKINGAEVDTSELAPGMKVSLTLAEGKNLAASIESPSDEKQAASLKLPEGFRGSAKNADPKYLNSTELKEEYLKQCFTVERGAQRFLVSQVDREPLGFTAFARSMRLSAIHDFGGKNCKIVEEGPTTIGGAKAVKWQGDEGSPLKMDEVNAYTVLVEGVDENGKHLESRQIAIQGEGTMMYVIKATAPVDEWSEVGEAFDAAISTFKIAAAQ